MGFQRFVLIGEICTSWCENGSKKLLHQCVFSHGGDRACPSRERECKMQMERDLGLVDGEIHL